VVVIEGGPRGYEGGGEVTALEHARAIYDINCVGCCWHIVLDDHNWDEDLIRSCMRNAEAGGISPGDIDCETPEHCKALGPLLLAMSAAEQNEFYDALNEWPPGTAASMDEEEDHA